MAAEASAPAKKMISFFWQGEYQEGSLQCRIGNLRVTYEHKGRSLAHIEGMIHTDQEVDERQLIRLQKRIGDHSVTLRVDSIFMTFEELKTMRLYQQYICHRTLEEEIFEEELKINPDRAWNAGSQVEIHIKPNYAFVASKLDKNREEKEAPRAAVVEPAVAPAAAEPAQEGWLAGMRGLYDVAVDVSSVVGAASTLAMSSGGQELLGWVAEATVLSAREGGVDDVMQTTLEAHAAQLRLTPEAMALESAIQNTSSSTRELAANGWSALSSWWSTPNE